MKLNYEAQFVPYKACNRAGKGPALVFAPHSDDEAIGCGGAIIKHVDNNELVHVVIVTDGRLGDHGLAMKIRQGIGSETEVNDYIAIRQQESCKAGDILGYGKPLFWGITDRELACDEKMVKKVNEAINLFKPCAVYSPSIYEMHPDHRTLAMIVLKAIGRLDRKPDLFMYEIGRPMPSPDILLDITDQWDQKMSAVRSFKSQLKVCPFHEYTFSLNMFRSFTLPVDVKMAEAYLVIRGHDFNNRIKDILMDEFRDRGKGQYAAHKDSFPRTLAGRIFSPGVAAVVRALKQIFQRER
jgi:LmbE family N-acetylglucosaminyl deacetylase